MNTPTPADLVVRAGRVHTLDPGAPPVTALAVQDAEIRAVAGPGEETEFLAAWTGPRTVVAEHPVLALRGGHNGVLNSTGLRLAGIGPDVPGGFIARDAAGRPEGWLQDAALERALAALPALPTEALVEGIATASATYAAHGLGTVRDAAVTPAEWQACRVAQAAGKLRVRSHVMILSTPAAIDAAGGMDAYLDSLVAQGIEPGEGEGLLRLWGLKFIADGGVEAAALSEPYRDRPGYHGELLWPKEKLTEALSVAVRRGWPVGIHAFGDRAVGQLLDVIRALGPVPRGMLVVEHGGLIGGRIADAAELGVHITAQQALLDGLSPALLAAWGPDRPADLFPWRELVDAGAWLSAGTDHPIGPLDPLRGVHGMTTRRTPSGVLGAKHAIDRADALRLYTVAGAELLGVPGTLTVGAPADLVCYPADPFTCPTEDLLTLTPRHTVVAGKLVHGT